MERSKAKHRTSLRVCFNLYLAVAFFRSSDQKQVVKTVVNAGCRPVGGSRAFVKTIYQSQSSFGKLISSFKPVVSPIPYGSVIEGTMRKKCLAPKVVPAWETEKFYTLLYHLSRASFSLSNSPHDEEEDGAPVVRSTCADLEDPTFQEDDELSDEIFERLEDGAPPLGQVLSQLLGINIFTYILAGVIAVMLAANAILGPGWLGQVLGLPGTGTFTDVSKTLPSEIDLSKPEYLL